MKPRARDLGLPFPGETGPFNAITDVPGVAAGFTTLDEPATETRGPLLTGVTAILPRTGRATLDPVWAGVHSLNGNGELTGTHWIEDGGWFAGPILLTNTHSVGVAHHAAIRWMVDRFPDAFANGHLWRLPVVGETYDGVLNDINAQGVTEAHVLAALDGARGGPVAEGSVGGGAGMIAYEFKAGTGTSSRMIEHDGRRFAVAALVQANHGLRGQLTVLGVPVGLHLPEDRVHDRDLGSIIVVIATDAPLLPHQLRRVAKRGAIGIGRGGSVSGSGSGDIILAFTTANLTPIPALGPKTLRLEAMSDAWIDPLYAASVEATEEAVVNALLAAEDRVAFKPAGQAVRALPRTALDSLLQLRL